MWTMLAHRIFIPTITHWDHVEGNRGLPLLVTQDGFMVWQEEIRRRANCNRLYLIVDGKVEPLCLFCLFFMRCQVVKKVGGNRFEPDSSIRIGWTRNDLQLLRQTMEIPFLAAWPLRQWKSTFGYSRNVRFSFSRADVLQRLTILKNQGVAKYLDRPYMCYYVSRQFNQQKVTRDEVNVFPRRMMALIRRLNDLKEDDYKERLTTLKL